MIKENLPPEAVLSPEEAEDKKSSPPLQDSAWEDEEELEKMKREDEWSKRGHPPLGGGQRIFGK